MTADEIKKAVDCCSHESKCNNCPLQENSYCKDALSDEVLVYINQLEAEVERLEKELSISQVGYVSMEGKAWELREQLKTAKSEALKEFADRLKSKLFYECGDINYSETCETRRLIDSLVKETEG